MELKELANHVRNAFQKAMTRYPVLYIRITFNEGEQYVEIEENALCYLTFLKIGFQIPYTENNKNMVRILFYKLGIELFDGQELHFSLFTKFDVNRRFKITMIMINELLNNQ